MLNYKTKALWQIWGIAFLYTCVVSVFIQFLLLPYLLPHLHAGGGLFLGCPDCIGFNQIAVNMAEKIKTAGWGAWEFRPQSHTIAGMASAIYALTWSKLWVLIPLNAVLHASAFLVLFQLINLFIDDKNRSFLCALPFLIFPSNLQWTSQLHKDGFSILGILLFLQGIISLSRLENWRERNWHIIIIRSFACCIAGIALIWFVRPFMLTMIRFFTALLFSFLIAFFSIRTLRSILSWQKTLFTFVSFLIIFFILSQVNVKFGSGDLLESPKFSGPVFPLKEHVAQKISVPETQKSAVYTTTLITASPLKEHVAQKISVLETQIESHWKRSSWLPLFIENKVYSLAQARKGFRFSGYEAKSNIDHNFGFNSVESMLIYLPRAAQIVLFAPFPNQWFTENNSSGSSFMHRISAFEMTVTYFTLIFLPFAIWFWRRRIEIWVIFLFCIYMMLIYGLVICNIGTLYRMRYVYIMTLLGLGIAGFFVFLDKLIIRRKQATG